MLSDTAHKRHRPYSVRGPKHGPGGLEERQRGIRECGGDDGGGGRVHDGAIPTEETDMGKGETDVEHGVGGQGGQVTDGLSPKY